MSYLGTLLPSGTVSEGVYYTATVDGQADIRGAIFTINVTAVTGSSPTLTITLQVYDQASATTIDLATVATITTTGTANAIVYPGASGAVYEVLPAGYRLKYVVSGGDTFTFSIGVNYLN